MGWDRTDPHNAPPDAEELAYLEERAAEHASLSTVPACAFAGPDCAGELQWHHVIKQQRLKNRFKYGAYRLPGDESWRPQSRYGVDYPEDIDIQVRTLDQIIGDPRNRMWLCSEGHHEPVTNGRLHPVPPALVWEFAREHGMDAELENDLARRRPVGASQ